MRRREFTLLGGAAAAWPLAARAQQRTLPVIGRLVGSQLVDAARAAFRQGLGEAGFVEGRNVAIEYRSAEGQYDRLPALAADLVRRRVDRIATSSPVAALAAKAATATIPIVFQLGSDPVKDGLVASLNRPGGNVTGVTFFANLLSAKRLELLQVVVPKPAVIAAIVNPDNSNAELELGETEVAARTLKLQLVTLRARTEREIEAAFTSLVQQRAAALFVTADVYLTGQRHQIVALATRHAIPTSWATRDGAEAGALMSYGAQRADSSRQFGVYVGRIPKGEEPADLPVHQPTRFEFVLNLKTAKALGLEIPFELHA